MDNNTYTELADMFQHLSIQYKEDRDRLEQWREIIDNRDVSQAIRECVHMREHVILDWRQYSTKAVQDTVSKIEDLNRQILISEKKKDIIEVFSELYTVIEKLLNFTK